MEIVELVEKIGLPGGVVVFAMIAIMAGWQFFKSEIWPYQKQRAEREMARQEVQSLKMNDICHELNRVVERLDQIEYHCIEQTIETGKRPGIPLSSDN